MMKGSARTTVERQSRGVLYGLVGLVVVVFGLFYALGQSAMTDVLLFTMYGMLLLAVVLALGSVVHGVRQGGRAAATVNRIPSTRIAWLTGLSLLAVLLLTFLLASTEPLTINGVLFTDALWLRLSDMFINASLVLMFVAVLAVLVGMSGYGRKMK